MATTEKTLDDLFLDTLKGRIPPEQGHMLSLLG